MSQATERQLQSVLSELAARRIEGLKLFEPMAQQEAFMKCRASQRIVRGGWRGGKTLIAAVECARAATHQDPYDKYPNRPLVIWIMAYEEGNIGRTIYRLLFRADAYRIIRDLETGDWRSYRPWDPSDKSREKETKPAPPLIPNRFIDSIAWKDKGRRIFSVVRLKDGTEILAFSSGGEPPTGDWCDLVWIDEDLQYPEHLKELQGRLSDRKGRLIWSAKPRSKNDALMDLSAMAERQVDRPDPDVAEFALSLSGNIYIDADEKRKRHEGWTEEEVRLFDYGEFITDSILIYPSFHIDVHGAPIQADTYGRPLPIETQPTEFDKIVCRGHVPLDWTRYMVVDPGHTVCCVLFFAVPPPELGDHVLLERELYLRNCDPANFGDCVRTVAEGRRFEAFIIDDQAGRVRTYTSLQRTKDLYSEELKKHKIFSAITGHGFIAGSTDIEGRITKFRTWLTIREDGTTKFRIMRGQCPNFIREIGRYRKKMVGHMMEDVPTRPKDFHAMACFDSETEVLSNGGWVRFSELPRDASVATVNLASDTIEYEEPYDYITKEWCGEMVAIGGRKMDVLVTPDHRMVSYPMPGCHGWRRGDPAMIRQAGELTPWDRLKLTAGWIGEDRDEPILLPHVHGCKPELEKEIDPLVWAEFLGWYVAEGCADATVRCPGKGYRVTVSQKNQTTRTYLREFLKKTPWKWCEVDGGFVTSSKQLWSFLRPLGGSYDKYVPQWVKDSSQAVIERFVFGAMMGDGCYVGVSDHYHTVSKRLADDMQELYIKTSRSARVTLRPDVHCVINGREVRGFGGWRVVSRKLHVAGLRDWQDRPTFHTEQYEGMVYCVSVPNGTLIVRRNGIPLVAGNCIEYAAAYGCPYVERKHSPQSNPVYEQYKKLLRKRKERGEKPYVNLGPGSLAKGSRFYVR